MSGRGTSETNGDEVRRSACGRQSGHRVQGGSNGRLCATLTASKHIVLGPCLSDNNIEPWLLRSRVGCLRSKAAYAPREQRLQLAILWFRGRQNRGWSGCGEKRFPQQQAGYARAQRLLTFGCSSLRKSSWSSISRPPRRSASTFRQPCSPAPTR